MDLLIYSVIFALVIYSLAISTRKTDFQLSCEGFTLKPCKYNIFIYFSLGCYILLRTFAYNTGADYLAYFGHYMDRANDYINPWGEQREVGYRILIDALSSVIKSPNAFFLICSALGLGTVVKLALKYGKAAPYIVLGWILFLFNLSMNLYRQYIAMAIMLIGYLFLLSNKSRKHLIIASLCGIWAFLFHHSSAVGIVMMVIIYLLRNKQINKWWLIFGICITTVSSMTILKGLIESFGSYSDMYMEMNDRSYMASDMYDSMYDPSKVTYVNMLCSIIIVWYGDKVMRTNSHLRFLYYTLAFSLLVEPLMRQEILMRMRLYLVNFAFIGYGLIVYFSISKFCIKKLFPLLVVVSFHIAYMYVYQNLQLFVDFPLIFK